MQITNIALYNQTVYVLYMYPLFETVHIYMYNLWCRLKAWKQVEYKICALVTLI